MKDRNELLIKIINNHYKEILEELEIIHDNFEEYCDNLCVRKAIWLDVMQIGENVNHFTDEFGRKIGLKDMHGITSIRNYIVHGYVYTNKETVWNTIHEDLPRLIESLKNSWY